MFLNGQLTDINIIGNTLLAFILFCLTSSAIYCINDAVDAPYDAANPDKCHRPVAAGEVSRFVACAIAAGLVATVGLTVLLYPDAPVRHLAVPLGTYFILNLGYSFYLKRLPVIDVIVIALCFLLRILAGGIAGGIPLTQWTLILVFLLTLMLATGKRRYEAWQSAKTGVESRSNIRSYNLRFLNIMLILLSFGVIGCYVLWTLSDTAQTHFGTHLLFITSIFVALGTGRYLYLILKDNSGGNPTRILLHDRFIMTCVAGWLITFAYILYL